MSQILVIMSVQSPFFHASHAAEYTDGSLATSRAIAKHMEAIAGQNGVALKFCKIARINAAIDWAERNGFRIQLPAPQDAE